MNERMYLTNSSSRVIHIYNGKSVTKFYYERSGSICICGYITQKCYPDADINKLIEVVYIPFM